MTNPPAAPAICDCGDPACTYVANLNAAMEWMRKAAGVPHPVPTGSAAHCPDEH